MEIGIVGAGIAGLSAAISLRQAGHNVEIFERSRFSNETGAAIAVPPNAARILRQWGFDFEKAQSVKESQMRFASGHDLKELIRSSFEDCEERYGSYWYNMHRVDIHHQLREIAEDSHGKGQPAKIRLASEVVDLDFDKTIIGLADGSKFKKDVLVLADGSHCKFLKTINGSPIQMEPSGITVYRTMIPLSKILAKPNLAPLWQDQPTGLFLIMDLETKYLTVTYPCRNNTLINWAFLRPTTDMEKDAPGDDWHHPSSKEEVKDWFKGTAYHPTCYDLVDLADDVQKFHVMTHKALDQLCLRNVVVIGDAAHPMLPTHAEGGAMAIEDAAALGIVFQQKFKTEEVERRLQAYHEIRHARSMITQMMSNNRTNVMPHAEQEVKAKEWGFLEKLPEDNALYFKQDFRDFFYAYRVEEEAEKVLRVHGLD